MDTKEPKDIETSASSPKPGAHDAHDAHDAHLVLIPQPSTHPRDPLVCHARRSLRISQILSFGLRRVDILNRLYRIGLLEGNM